MKKNVHILRASLVVALALILGQAGGCGESGKKPFGPDAIIADSCGPNARRTEPSFLKKVSPVYPELAKRAGIEGTVWVSVLIDTTGLVIDVKVVKDSGTNAGLEEASINAAWQQVFNPAMKCGGRPIAVWATFAFEFRL